MTEIAILDPDLPIIDTHHHFFTSNHWHPTGARYMLDEYVADLDCGHNLLSTVFVECSQAYRLTGPDHLRTRGEVELAATLGRLSDTGDYGSVRVCEGIVGRAELADGAAVERELDALVDAGDGRLKSIRRPLVWHPESQVNHSFRPFAPKGLMQDDKFREGLSRLASYDLAFDASIFYPQMAELVDLAGAVPDVTIVLNHCGGLSGVDPFDNWRSEIVSLAALPNVYVKLGGIANSRVGLPPDATGVQTLETLVTAWSPYIETCISAFGPERCMFESNFPVDQMVTSYGGIWNVFKTIVAGASAPEKAALFSGTARRVYKMR